MKFRKAVAALIFASLSCAGSAPFAGIAYANSAEQIHVAPWDGVWECDVYEPQPLTIEIRNSRYFLNKRNPFGGEVSGIVLVGKADETWQNLTIPGLVSKRKPGKWVFYLHNEGPDGPTLGWISFDGEGSESICKRLAPAGATASSAHDAAVGKAPQPAAVSTQADSAAVEAYKRLDIAALTKMAQAGNSYAQALLGALYVSGRGVKQDLTAAVSWFRKSAEQGRADAQYVLGQLYAGGVGGLAQDNAAAVSWFRKSAEQGNAGAQLNLGVMYADGTGVAQDYAQAYHWFSLSAAGTTDPELKTKAEKYGVIVLSRMQKNSVPAAAPIAPPKANPAQIASKNVPAAPAKNANLGKPIFCEFRQGEDEGRTKFVIYRGPIKRYGGGNAWEAPISFSKGDPFTVQFEFPKKANLNYGAGMYTISSPSSKASFSFDRDDKNWAYIDDENYINCDFDK